MLTYELCGNVENGLEGKPSAAEIEEIFETRSEQLHHQGIVLPAWSEIVHLRYTLYMCVMNYIDRQSRSPQITPNMRAVFFFFVLLARSYGVRPKRHATERMKQQNNARQCSSDWQLQ